MTTNDLFIVDRDDPILVTGATGFIGSKVLEALLREGFRNLRCVARSLRGVQQLEKAVHPYREQARIEILCGDLLSPSHCAAATRDVAVVYHLAAGAGEKSVAAAFLNSVVTTRNLLEAIVAHGRIKRFVNVSSFAVYDVSRKRGRVLDESCPVEAHPELLVDAYEFAKVKQDELVSEYCGKFHIPIVTVRPGYVYGPGKSAISGRVGIGTFGLFLHLGGSNIVPLTYVENCAEAIVLAGLKAGVEGEVFNVLDDELPSSRTFLGLYKKNVRRFPSLYLPHWASYLCCLLWERYSASSHEQLPPTFNRRKWHKFWGSTRYSNRKVKTMLGWQPRVATGEGLRLYFESCRGKE